MIRTICLCRHVDANVEANESQFMAQYGMEHSTLASQRGSCIIHVCICVYRAQGAWVAEQIWSAYCNVWNYFAPFQRRRMYNKPTAAAAAAAWNGALSEQRLHCLHVLSLCCCIGAGGNSPTHIQGPEKDFGRCFFGFFCSEMF